MSASAKNPKIIQGTLLKKLETLDARLLNVWLRDEPPLSDEERWDIFVTLLETRVSLLKSIRDTGLRLSEEQCLPRWLERLSQSRFDVRRREIRLFDEERKLRKKMGIYETVAAATVPAPVTRFEEKK